MSRYSQFLLVVVGCLLVANNSSATSDFPGAIQGDLALSYTPQCSLCHAGDPGPGTATMPFAISMKARGLQPYDEASLAAALKQLEADGTDSDHDGIPDVVELREGSDPNLAGSLEPVSYGCSLTRPRHGSGAAIAAVLVGFGLVLVSRERRRLRGRFLAGSRAKVGPSVP